MRTVRFTPPLEKQEQQAAVTLFRVFGATVYHQSQFRPSKVAIGIPDTWVMLPSRRLAWYWEAKRYLDRWRDEHGVMIHYHPMRPETWRPHALAEPQARFREQCEACLIRHYWGGRREAEDALIDMGLATRSDNGLILTPMRRSA